MQWRSEFMKTKNKLNLKSGGEALNKKVVLKSCDTHICDYILSAYKNRDKVSIEL